MASPLPSRDNSIADWRWSGQGSLHRGIATRLMSARGQKRKSQLVVKRSALPPKTDIESDIVRVGLCQGPPLCCGFFFQKLSRRPNSPMVALVEMRWPVAQYPCQRFDRIKIQFLPYRVSE